MKRRIISIFLVFAMIISGISTAFAGQEGAGDIAYVQTEAEDDTGLVSDETGVAAATSEEAPEGDDASHDDMETEYVCELSETDDSKGEATEEAAEILPEEEIGLFEPMGGLYTVTIETEYGTLDRIEVSDIPVNTGIEFSGNTLCIGSTIVTATPDQGYHFSRWMGIPQSRKVTADITVTAVMEQDSVVTDNAYLTFSSSSSFTLNTYSNEKNWNGTLYYATKEPEKETSWQEWAGTDTLTAGTDAEGYKLYLRGTGNTRINYYADSSGSWQIAGEGITCSGNIETLLNYQTVKQGNHPEMESGCFLFLFCNCTGLVEAPQLPATELASVCYAGMFYGCTGLVDAPQLPATELTVCCYEGMFMHCTSLTEAPELPATELAANCYRSMFSDCTGLTEAPQLPATELPGWCYNYMFYGCTGLTEAPQLPATKMANGCYFGMFNGCTGLTTLPELPATILAEFCYEDMFKNCSSVALYDTWQEGATEWKLPSEGVIARTKEDWNKEMFSGTGGAVTEPEANKKYYFKPVGQETLYKITINAGAGGSVDKTEVRAAAGTSISSYGNKLTIGSEVITATPASGYSFNKWTGIPADGKVTGDTTITAVMDYSGGGGGGSTGSGGGGGGGSTGSSATGGPSSQASASGGTFSRFWFCDTKDIWRIKNKGTIVTGVWLCDDAVAANGKNVWYLLNADGTMCTAGLVQDNTGSFYSIETNHNGYFGMLRYKNGTYNCNGQQVYLEFSQKHDGTFGAVTNAEGLAALKAIYGVTKFPIGNDRCMYTSTFSE